MKEVVRLSSVCYLVCVFTMVVFQIYSRLLSLLLPSFPPSQASISSSTMLDLTLGFFLSACPTPSPFVY